MSWTRRNWAFVKLAVVTNLEYRLNYFIDALVQPAITAGIELAFWGAVFISNGQQLLGGFSRESYLAYAIWASFIARVSTIWMYVFRMVEEVESGTLNTLLVRPMSFFEYYLSQFLGYKIVTTLVSLVAPLLICWAMDLPFAWLRLIPALALATYYLVFLFLLSFIIVTVAFHLTRIQGISIAKNLTLWIFSGELIPLDLFPSPFKEILIHLPFSSGVYIPVSYLTGRIDGELMQSAVISITLGIVVLSLVAVPLWRLGLRRYVGTGA